MTTLSLILAGVLLTLGVGLLVGLILGVESWLIDHFGQRFHFPRKTP